MGVKIIADRYKLISGIESTQSSIIWLAKDLLNNELVAVKILSSITANANGVKELVRRESESLSRLSHPNIINLIDSGVENDKLYLVTEYFESKNLKKFAQEEALDTKMILEILLKILEGLAEAHQKNVIHRDLKPSNILVDEFMQVKIIDFGISKIMGYVYDSTETLKDYMTVAYASPEQLCRKEAKPTSDLFSVGGILYFLLTGGDPPSDKADLYQKVKALSCDSEIKTFLDKLLQDDPNYRTQSVNLAIRQVKSLLANMQEKMTIHIKLYFDIAKQLYSVGLISHFNQEYAKSFIQKDLQQGKIYKRNRTYFLIGEKAKYHCELKNNSYFSVKKINSLDFIEWEQYTKHAVDIKAIWVIITSDQKSENTVLIDFLSQVGDEEKKRQVELKREEKQAQLLSKWERYIDEQISNIRNLERKCTYCRFELSKHGDQLVVDVDEQCVEFEKGDFIRMSLASGKSVSVGTLDEIKENKIWINLNRDIDLQSISQKGALGIDAIQLQTNLKRLKWAVKAIRNRTSVNPNLTDIINDPSMLSMYALTPISDFYQDLDDSNQRAVTKALSTKDLFLVQGPPGTGKTSVIAEIICQILSQDPKAKILLSSQSHVAVDHALENISFILKDEKLIIRIGRYEKISKDSRLLLMAHQLQKWIIEISQNSKKALSNYVSETYQFNDDYKKRIDFIIQNDNVTRELIDEVVEQENIKKIIILTKEWHKRLGKLDEFDEIFAQKASIVAATCLGIASRNALLNTTIFDWVIVDEAGRATAPELLVPIIRGKKVVLVGDHRQLPPVVNNELKTSLKQLGITEEELEKSLFEELIEKAPSNTKTILTAQFRMHPNIANLISNVFYPTEDIISKKSPEERKHNLPWWPKTITWFDTSSMPDPNEQDVNTTKKNSAEALIILKTLELIDRSYSTSNIKITVGVISGYSAQKSLMYNLINPNSSKWQNIKIVIDNVDAFQGSETDISIYSLVRSNPDNNIGFLSDYRRLNVALSRGKTALIIIGNANFAKKAQAPFGNPFADLLLYIEKNPLGCIIEDAKNYFQIGGN